MSCCRSVPCSPTPTHQNSLSQGPRFSLFLAPSLSPHPPLSPHHPELQANPDPHHLPSARCCNKPQSPTSPSFPPRQKLQQALIPTLTPNMPVATAAYTRTFPVCRKQPRAGTSISCEQSRQVQGEDQSICLHLQLRSAPNWHAGSSARWAPSSAMDAGGRFQVGIGATTWVHSSCHHISTG